MSRSTRSGDSCSATNPNSPVNGLHSQQHKKRRRRELQQQCLLPSGLSASNTAEARIQAWLDLLGISEEQVSLRTLQLPKQQPAQQDSTTSSQVSNIVKESLSASIPLDKDGWQVADQDLLTANTSSAAGIEHDGWKVVKSKRSRRHLSAGTAATNDQPRSSGSGPSKHSSTIVSEATTLTGSSPAMFPGSDSSEFNDNHASDLSDGLAKARNESRTDSERFPNLSIRDIEQVAKDVERSFIGPAFQELFRSTAQDDDHGPSISPEKALRRKQLTHLVLTTLAAHPSLNYFQGYHDILSIILLTCAPTSPETHSSLFADEKQQATVELIAERISLHVIRDSMTPDLLPIMGQLKILAKLLRLCDADVAELAERASPMPFFALPWLLTLLTHDAAEVAVMQRVLEFVLAYGPAAAVYLCATVPLIRKDEILAMDADELEDPVMLHTILSKLPSITADAAQVEHGGAEIGKAEDDAADAIYTDPDAELPSLASDRALAGPKKPEPGVPISTLLHKADQLMKAHPLTSASLQANKVMGASSVLFTWSTLFDSTSSSVDWKEQDLSAEAILSGPIDAIVVDPHPPSPPSDEGYYEDKDAETEKTIRKSRLPVASNHAQMLALVGFSGLLVAAFFTAASQNSSAAGASASLATEETKRVVALVVSLLSNWGRVVGTA